VPNCRCKTPTDQSPQSLRQYSSSPEASTRWWNSSPVRYGIYGVGSAGLGLLLIDNYRLRRKTEALEQVVVEALTYNGTLDPAEKVFKGGEQGFIKLKLESVTDVNHNTKRFKFKFDDPKAVSGLSYCCKADNIRNGAILTSGSGAIDKTSSRRCGQADDSAVHPHQP
jgi:cytochrome-b5 reductase